MKVYISAPIDRLDLDKSDVDFAETEVYLESLGYKVINPMKEIIHLEFPTSFEVLYERIKHIYKADAVYMGVGWENDRDSSVEFYIANEYGKDIFYEGQDLKMMQV
jgi:hypothetical protein